MYFKDYNSFIFKKKEEKLMDRKYLELPKNFK